MRHLESSELNQIEDYLEIKNLDTPQETPDVDNVQIAEAQLSVVEEFDQLDKQITMRSSDKEQEQPQKPVETSVPAPFINDPVAPVDTEVEESKAQSSNASVNIQSGYLEPASQVSETSSDSLPSQEEADEESQIKMPGNLANLPKNLIYDPQQSKQQLRSIGSSATQKRAGSRKRSKRKKGEENGSTSPNKRKARSRSIKRKQATGAGLYGDASQFKAQKQMTIAQINRRFGQQQKQSTLELCDNQIKQPSFKLSKDLNTNSKDMSIAEADSEQPKLTNVSQQQSDARNSPNGSLQLHLAQQINIGMLSQQTFNSAQQKPTPTDGVPNLNNNRTASQNNSSNKSNKKFGSKTRLHSAQSISQSINEAKDKSLNKSPRKSPALQTNPEKISVNVSLSSQMQRHARKTNNEHEQTEDEISIGIMGKLSKVQVGMQEESVEAEEMKDDVDVGFSNSLDKEASETAAGGKGHLNLSGTQDSFKIRQINTGPQLIIQTDLLKNELEGTGGHPEDSFQTCRGDDKEKLIQAKSNSQRDLMKASNRRASKIKLKESHSGNNNFHSEAQNFKTIPNQEDVEMSQHSIDLSHKIQESKKKRNKTITITDLQKQLAKKSMSRLSRIAWLEKFTEKLRKDNMGYFHGKKVPFAKNMSYKQCLFNPYIEASASFITVQVVGRLIDSNYGSVANDEGIDNLTRKMQKMQKDVKYFEVSKNVDDKAVFELSPQEANLHNYGTILQTKSTHVNPETNDYAIVTFWDRAENNKHQVFQSIFIEKALSHIVNSDNELHEVVFEAYNISMPFLFSIKPQQSNSSFYNGQLLLNLLGEPDPSKLSKEQTQKRQKTMMKKEVQLKAMGSNLSVDKTIIGLNQLEIGVKSFLDMQIRAYMKNQDSQVRSNRSPIYPLRAPTIVQIQDKGFVVMTKTIDRSQKTSVCFVEFIDCNEMLLSSSPLASSNNTNQVLDKLSGEVAYEIPGAEMFLGLDSTAKKIFYLTNKMFSNLEHPCIDPIEARFSSPPLVKMITIEQAQMLQMLLTEQGVPQFADRKNQNNVNYSIQRILESQKSWEVTGDRQTMDFYRCYSVDYPYCEGHLHDENSQMTLLFFGHESRTSVSLTFTLTPMASHDAKKSLSNEIAQALKKRVLMKAGTVQPVDPLQGQVESEIQPRIIHVGSLETDTDGGSPEKVDTLQHEKEELKKIEVRKSLPNSPIATQKWSEKLSGWYQVDDDTVQLDIKARLWGDDMEIEAKGKNKAGKKFDIDFASEQEEWTPVGFKEYIPVCPFKLDHVELDPQTMISGGKGTTQGSSSIKFKLKQMRDFQADKECDPCGYPNEKKFAVICESDRFESKNIEVTMQGLCHLAPFSTRLMVVYQEKRGHSIEDVTTRRIILEKKIKADMVISSGQGADLTDMDEKASAFPEPKADDAQMEFQVQIHNGVIEEKALMKLTAKKSLKEHSVMLEDAHKIVKSDRGEVFVLHGSLYRCNDAIKGISQDQDPSSKYLSLIEVSKPMKPLETKKSKLQDKEKRVNKKKSSNALDKKRKSPSSPYETKIRTPSSRASRSSKMKSMQSLRIPGEDKDDQSDASSKKEEEMVKGKGAQENAAQEDSKSQLTKINIPVEEIVTRIARGGLICNENGLIYAIKFVSKENVKLVSVGYEYQHSAPQVNFFDFDLKQDKNEDGDVKNRFPAIQSPVPQHFIAEFPMVAYKSFMSDNSEIVIYNTAQKNQSQRIVKLVDWRFICFVNHAMMKELPEVKKFDCNILYLAQHKKLHQVRLFTIKDDPWVKDPEQFGVVECFPSAHFDLPSSNLSFLKKVDLLIQFNESKRLQMALVFQYTEDLWTVPLSVHGEATKLLPSDGFSMIQRHTIRNKTMESSLIYACINQETGENKLVKVSIDQNKPEHCLTEDIYVNENTKIVAFEMDTEDDSYLYFLDDEKLLYHLENPEEGKCKVNLIHDLSCHSQMEEQIEDFENNFPWSSIHVDNRTITIRDRTFSLKTNFSYASVTNEDQKRQKWRKSVGNRAERLLHSQPIPGTLLIFQVWKADEYYFFRAKPTPGTCIIDVIGQMCTEDDCEMYFIDNMHVMVHIADGRILTFDKEGYIVKKEFPLYLESPKVHLESPIFDQSKYFVLQDKDNPRVFSLVQQQEDEEPIVLEQPFSLDDLEEDLRQLKNNDLISLLGLDKLGPAVVDSVKNIKDHIKLHHEHMLLSKGGFLFLIASTIFNDVEESQSIFEQEADHDSHKYFHVKEKKAKKEDFEYENSQKLFGHFKFRNINIVFIMCRDLNEQSQLSDSRFTGISETQINTFTEARIKSIDAGGRGQFGKSRRVPSHSMSLSMLEGEQVENKPVNYSFALVDNRLIWVNYEQKRIWELDISQMLKPRQKVSLGTSILGLKSLSKSSPVELRGEGHHISWEFLHCKSFTAPAIFQGMTAEEFEENGIRIHEINESSTVRQRKIAEVHDHYMDLVQFTAANTAIVMNLTNEKPYVIEICHEIDQFKYPLYFSSCGFVYHTKNQTMQTNQNETLGFKRPLRPHLVNQSKGLYRPFAEVDLQQVLNLTEIVVNAEQPITKAEIDELEPLTVSASYNNETFFSIFAEQGAIYEVFYDQIRGQDAQSEKKMLSHDEFELLMRRLRYVITRPTTVYDDRLQPVTQMSILKQVVLFTDQKSRVSMYRLADFFDLDLTDYISCTADLKLVIEHLPSAQYTKMFDKFQKNVFTMQIKEAVLPKRIRLKTFCTETPVITPAHEEFGLHKDISDNEAMRKVQVRILPLNWIFVNGNQLSTLFREFRVLQEKFQGSLLLDVMFDAFWSDFKWKIFAFCFLPYLVYFCITFMYLIQMLFDPEEEAPEFDFKKEDLEYLDTWEPPLRWIFTILLLFHMGIQVKQLLSDGLKSHLKQIQNVMDIVSYLLNFTVLICVYIRKADAMKIGDLRFLGSIAGLFLWLQIIFWLRLFDNTAQYVSMVLRTITGIFNFMVVMLMIILAFGTLLYLAQVNRIYEGATEDDLVFAYNPGDYLFYQSIVNQYFLVLGDFENMNLNDDNILKEGLVTIGFLGATFLIQITILNMLIAIMGDTFNQHVNEQDVQSKQQKLLLLSVYIDLVEFYTNRCKKCIKKKNPLFVIVVTLDIDDDADDDIADANELQAVKRTVEQKFVSLNNSINKKIKSLQQLGTDTRSRMSLLQTESKTRMIQVQNIIMSETAKKLNEQEKNIANLEEQVQTEIKQNTKKILDAMTKQTKAIELIQKDLKEMKEEKNSKAKRERGY